MKNSIVILSAFLMLFLITGFSSGTQVAPAIKEKKVLTAITNVSDSVDEDLCHEVDRKAEPSLKLYKSNVLATYYADKFNGRKTTSGERFHNKKYTAAHMRLPFGTMVRVTNESNGKFVDVKVNDRGPYSKKLEIDLTKTAFMEIASRKSSGSFKVKIEIIEKK